MLDENPYMVNGTVKSLEIRFLSRDSLSPRKGIDMELFKISYRYMAYQITYVLMVPKENV